MDASTSAEKECESSGTKEIAEPLLLTTHVEDDFEELSEEIPDPFSDDEDGEIVEDPFLQQPIGMVTSITSMVNPDIEDEEEEEGEEEEGLTPIFVPSLSYLAQVSLFGKDRVTFFDQYKKKTFFDGEEFIYGIRCQVSFRQQCLDLRKVSRRRSLERPCLYL